MKEKILSDLVFERFSLYHRCVNKLLVKPGVEYVDSKELSRLLDIDPSLIRRDLSLLGKMGKRGLGYSLDSLNAGISSFLGKEKQWNIVIVGIGNLGKAIYRYVSNKKSNYCVIKLFDNDINKIGSIVENHSVENFTSEDIPDDINIGIITTPAKVANEVANMLIKRGVGAILNFAPIKLNLPENILYREIDVLKELDIFSGMLTFSELNRK